MPRHRLSTFGRRAFAVAGPMSWNSLPNSLRESACDDNISDDCFKHSLKAFLFSGYWRTERSRGVYDSALYKCTFTNLLTYLLTDQKCPRKWRKEEISKTLKAHTPQTCTRPAIEPCTETCPLDIFPCSSSAYAPWSSALGSEGSTADRIYDKCLHTVLRHSCIYIYISSTVALEVPIFIIASRVV